MKLNRIAFLLKDIRFWILLFLVIRLFGITNAPLETGHNWRQALTNMIARNFLEDGANLLYPKADWAGEKSGIIASEFPFFNYLIFLAAKCFGYTHWYGRLINLIISSIGLWYFYKLLKRALNNNWAFNATLLLIASIWFSFSRKMMPDTFSVSLLIIGFYHGFRFLKEGKYIGLLYFFLFSTLGVLCKIPALSLFSVLVVVPFIKDFSISRKISLLATATLGFAIISWWYFYWSPYLAATYQFPLYFPRSLSEGFHEIMELWSLALEKFYFSAFHSFIAFVLVIRGLLMLLKAKSYNYVKYSLFIASVFFCLFAIKTGKIFPLHNYYIVPFVPVMAILGGYTLYRLTGKWRIILLVLAVVEGIANQQHDFFIKDREFYKLQLEEIASKNIEKSALVILNSGPSPQQMYFANRSGWVIRNKDLFQPHYLDSLIQKGGRYLIIDKGIKPVFTPNHTEKFSNQYYSIYELTQTENKFKPDGI